MRMRWQVALTCALTGCATAPPQPAPRPQSRVVVQPPAPEAPRWQPRAAVADGVAVPGGRRHLVKLGETGLSIARAYGVPWARIVAANRLAADAPLEVGQALLIPTAPRRPAGPQPTPEQRAAGFALDVNDLVSGTTAARPAAPTAQRAPAKPAPAGQVASAPRAAPAAPAAPQAAAPRFSWPTDGRVIVSGFGPKPGGRVNDGINIRAVAGSPVRAAADGVVIFAGDAIAGYGNLLLVRHAGGWVTAYGHLQTMLATRGQTVSRGATIGTAGSTGNVGEPQLHFQTRQGRRAVNPAPLLR